MMIKKMIKTIAVILALMMLSGCMGRNGLVGKVIRWDLETAESRWGREGLFILSFPVILVCFVFDLLIFNSIEFWTGENSINGKSPVVDMPKEEVQKLGMNGIDRARVERLSKTKANLYLDFTNGDSATFDVIRDGSNYSVSYLGVKFYSGTLAL